MRITFAIIFIIIIKRSLIKNSFINFLKVLYKGIIIRKQHRDVAAGRVAYPACGVCKQPDTLERGFAAHVKPVGGVCRYADQVALFAQNGVDDLVDVQVK